MGTGEETQFFIRSSTDEKKREGEMKEESMCVNKRERTEREREGKQEGDRKVKKLKGEEGRREKEKKREIKLLIIN